MTRSVAIEPAKSVSLPVKEVIFSEELISLRVRQLAREITRDYKGEELLVVGILKGAQIFACDLVRYLDLSTSLDFMSISSYKQAPGLKEVKITKDLDGGIEGKHVLLVEDIVDTGLTLNYLIDVLAARKPASVVVCSLLDRPSLRLAEIPLKYVGFEASQEFLVGYGLDYRDHYRDLPYIVAVDLP
jgi:hypoxanthine phosphoribosyltransferase